MKTKIRIPKVSEYSSVGMMKKWIVNIGEEFKKDDPLYVIDNLGDEHIIKAKNNGLLVEKLVCENQIIENNQVIGIYDLIQNEENGSIKPKVKVGGFFSKILGIG